MIVLTNRVDAMLRLIVAKDPGAEVGGFGRVEVTESGAEAVVTDLLIPEQEVGPAHVDVEGEFLVKTLDQLARQGETLRQWCLLWHSHAKMSPSPSTTDKEYLEKFAEEYGFMFGLVTNAAGAYHGYYAQTTPICLTAEKINVSVQATEHRGLRAVVENMMKVVTQRPAVTTPVVRSYTPPLAAGGAKPGAPPKNSDTTATPTTGGDPSIGEKGAPCWNAGPRGLRCVLSRGHKPRGVHRLGTTEWDKSGLVHPHDFCEARVQITGMGWLDCVRKSDHDKTGANPIHVGVTPGGIAIYFDATGHVTDEEAFQKVGQGDPRLP